ncbi:MAG: gluconate:H+ symporter [Saprospiraceae bacterium]|nr:gluconate:H+ symporter [Saprospiraceae bacterium]
MPLLIVALGIAILLFLILYWRINTFLALILVALGVGIAIGMEPLKVVKSIQSGVGSTLGDLALILGFGAMLGALIAESGAAQVITDRLIKLFGLKNVQWAMLLTGFIVGIPLFYSVGFLMVIPIIFVVTRTTRLPILYVGIPMIASLSVTHGFLPPHPAPTTIAGFYNADINLTLLYGLILAIPTVIIAGPIFGRVFKNMEYKAPKDLFKTQDIPADKLPSFGVSVFTGLVPVILMAAGAIAKLTLPNEGAFYKLIEFLGDPVISLFIALWIAIYTLGIRSGRRILDIMNSLTDSVKAIAMIMLIIAGGGAFKQVLVDSGISNYIVDMMKGASISPLILAWSIAAALRIALGSATVAALTAAGIIVPLVSQSGVNPELLVLATGAGSLTCSQVNDTGFWLFKEYFNLSIIETLKSWTVMETIVSVIGLAGCLILDLFV